MTWLMPSSLWCSRAQLAICQPTELSEIIESSARPDGCSGSESGRTPPKEVTWGNFAQIARCTLIASGVRPFSTDEPDEQAAPDRPPESPEPWSAEPLSDEP